MMTLSGCLGDPEDEPAPADELDGPTQATEVSPPVDNETSRPDPDLAPLRFPLERPVDAVYTYNGSFVPEETGLGGGFVTGAFVKKIDLSDVVPAEVPARIEIDVIIDAAHLPVVGPTARADPATNGTVQYESYWENPAPGRFTFGGLIKRAPSGTYGVALEAYTPGPTDPSQVDYQVQVNVTARPDAVPVGVPVAFALEDETATFETPDGTQAELLVYGSDDDLIDRLLVTGSETWTIPSGSGGDLVVVPIGGAGDVRILREARENETAGDLRALDLDRASGEPHEIVPDEVTTWDFDVTQRPLRVRVTVVGPPGEPWTCVGTLDVVLHAPAGPVLERTGDCPSPTNVPFMYEERRSWATQPGDAWLVNGTYSVAIDNTLWSGHHAYHTIETYVR